MRASQRQRSKEGGVVITDLNYGRLPKHMTGPIEALVRVDE